MNSNLRKTITAVISLAWAGTAWAAPQAFDFKDPKGVNNAVFRLDAPLEAINGTATGVSGTINYDPAQPELLSGKIVFDANSLTVPNPMMKEAHPLPYTYPFPYFNGFPYYYQYSDFHRYRTGISAES